MSELKVYPRYARLCLEEALADTPVVLVHGPRQCGKTTLARMVGDEAGYAYVTFDDSFPPRSSPAEGPFVGGLSTPGGPVSRR